MISCQHVRSDEERASNTYVGSSAQESDQGALYHILVDANAPDSLLALVCRALDVGRGLNFTALSNGVLLVVSDVQIHTNVAEGVGQTGNRAVATAMQLIFLAVNQNYSVKNPLEVLSILGLARCGRSR